MYSGGIDLELGEDDYEMIKEFQQELNEEQEFRIMEAKKLSYDFRYEASKQGRMCAPAIDREFMDWYRSNQDLDFTDMLTIWHKGFLTQMQKDIA